MVSIIIIPTFTFTLKCPLTISSLLKQKGFKHSCGCGYKMQYYSEIDNSMTTSSVFSSKKEEVMMKEIQCH